MAAGIAALVLMVGLTAGVAPQGTPYLPAGEEAPLFEAKGSDGNTHSLKAMTAKSPVFMVFWKERCPHNRRAAPIFNALKSAYGEKVNYSICTFLIGTDGKIAKVFEGYGAEAMKSLNESMAKVAGTSVAEVDLSGAPSRMTWG